MFTPLLERVVRHEDLTTEEAAAVMREVMELESHEICAELAITANNLWVILYRARMALRDCLEKNWFEGEGRRP